MKMKILIILLLAFVFLFSCKNKKRTNNTVEKTTSKIETIKKPKKLRIFFIDISGSFNKKQDNGTNYFDYAINDIISYLRDSISFGYERVDVKVIKSNSWSDNASVLSIDFSITSDFIYSKPEPSNDLKKKAWRRNKREYEQDAKKNAKKIIDKNIDKLLSFKNQYSNKGSDYTDIIEALNSINIDFDLSKYKNYIKSIIVFSDFIETKKKNIKELKIDLSDFTIEGRYVSKNLFKSSDKYLLNQKQWKDILNCKSLKFNPPQ